MPLAQHLRVLVVEDDFLVNEMITGLIEDIGYAVAGNATSGEHAIEMVPMLRPDVLLMDIAMEGMDGLEASRRILDLCPTPIVVLTAFDTPEIVERASQAGVGAYLVKPPQARELENAINIALARFPDICAMLELRKQKALLEESLRKAHAHLQALSGLLPLCPLCHTTRDTSESWARLEEVLKEMRASGFQPAPCPHCQSKKL